MSVHIHLVRKNFKRSERRRKKARKKPPKTIWPRPLAQETISRLYKRKEKERKNRELGFGNVKGKGISAIT